MLIVGGGIVSESSAEGGLPERIYALVAEQLGVDPGDMTPSADILEDLGADSLDVVEMVMAIEETFDIEIPDEDAEALRTLGDIQNYITKRLS